MEREGKDEVKRGLENSPRIQNRVRHSHLVFQVKPVPVKHMVSLIRSWFCINWKPVTLANTWYPSTWDVVVGR